MYREIGGQDERFEGWGGEDDAMSVTILRLADRTMTLAEARAWHLYHPRRPDEVYRADCYRSNLALANAYCSMQVDELRRLGDQRPREVRSTAGANRQSREELIIKFLRPSLPCLDQLSVRPFAAPLDRALALPFEFGFESC